MKFSCTASLVVLTLKTLFFCILGVTLLQERTHTDTTTSVIIVSMLYLARSTSLYS